MNLSTAVTRPARCALVNLRTLSTLECLFNPTELTEALQLNYSRLAVPGLPHQVLQFQGASSRQLSGVELYLDQLASDEDVTRTRDFLLALTAPPPDAQDVVSHAPPRALFVWPRFLTLEVVLTSAELTYQRFSLGGRPIQYKALLTFEEILDVRVHPPREA